ncbi:MAG: hypothetical protein QM278_09675 [Pseudomonadota bacterium]|nr:hypothetical protein [Pseudomonadota bacterium]
MTSQKGEECPIRDGIARRSTGKARRSSGARGMRAGVAATKDEE